MFLRIRDLKVYYEAAGTGQPVVLLHGWGTDSRSMRPILEFLTGSMGVRAYAVDFPGFGFSGDPPHPWGVSDFASLVLDLLDMLELARVSIVAHSFGGRVAIKLASEHPDRVEKLVLVASAGIRPDRSPRYYLHIWVFKAARLLARVLPSSVGKAVQIRILSRVGSPDYRASGEMRQTLIKVVNEDLRHFLPSIECPTLLVWGGLDTETPLEDARTMKQMIPDARLEILKNAGHFCYLDEPEAFARILSSFLRGDQ